jgi:uncharacterized protein with von Willebrand factor type A (vWA) domain
MGFADKMKKGLSDATRVGSSDLDKRRQEESLSDVTREMDDIKREMGNMIFISHVRGEQVDERFLRYCKRLEELVGKLNASNSPQNPKTDYTMPGEYDRGNGPL